MFSSQIGSVGGDMDKVDVAVAELEESALARLCVGKLGVGLGCAFKNGFNLLHFFLGAF